MSKYRHDLPQTHGRLFMTDGGLETTLVFHDGIDLPAFAAFDLMKDDKGMQRLREYYVLYTEMARDHGLGIVLEAPTWRANADWAAKLGYDTAALAKTNRRAIDLLRDVRTAYETPDMPIVISGCLGPRGDGYQPGARMSVQQAQAYHAAQIETFADTEADMIAAFTMNYTEEAIGIARAAEAAGMPAAISFTLEVDGRLPSGETLREAIARTDEATGAYPVYYMINCAHPVHFAHVLQDSGTWRDRVRGVRANASMRSHAELDESTDLDDGNPAELGRQYVELDGLLPQLAVVGGCCGTDHRHVDHICRAMLARSERNAAAAPA